MLLDWLPDLLVRPASLPSCLTIFIGYHSLLGYNSRYHFDLPLTYWSNSRIFTWPYPLAFLCHLSSSATLTWPSWSLCPANKDFYGSDMSLCNHWSFALEPTPSFYTIHFINWWAKCLFSFSQDCSLFSESLALEALLIGVHFKKRYINV